MNLLSTRRLGLICLLLAACPGGDPEPAPADQARPKEAAPPPALDPPPDGPAAPNEESTGAPPSDPIGDVIPVTDRRHPHVLPALDEGTVG